MTFRIGAAVAALLVCCAQLPLLQSCALRSHGSFEVDSLVFERSWALPNAMENDVLGGRSHFYVRIDYPKGVKGGEGEALADSVKLRLSEVLLPDSPQPVMNKTVLDVAANVFFGESEGNEWGEEVSYSLRKVYEDGEYLTYEFSRYAFSGGAHGRYNVTGVTFRKSDGRRVTWGRIGASDDLRKTITEELKEAKGILSDDELKNMLLVDSKFCTLADGAFALPLPNAAPWLTDMGWVFTYQPYEILPWCHGAPACCVKDLDVEFD